MTQEFGNCLRAVSILGKAKVKLNERSVDENSDTSPRKRNLVLTKSAINTGK